MRHLLPSPAGLLRAGPRSLDWVRGCLAPCFHHCLFFFPFSLDLGQLPLRNTLFRAGFVVFLFIVVPFFLFLSVLLFSV